VEEEEAFVGASERLEEVEIISKRSEVASSASRGKKMFTTTPVIPTSVFARALICFAG